MPYMTLDLTGKWQFKQWPHSIRQPRDLDASDWLDACVPNSIFENLIAAGKIDRKELDINPQCFSYVSEKRWTFKRVFDVPSKLLDCHRIDLVFDGLDTISSVWLNDNVIGKTNNMFTPFRFDVTKVAKEHQNSLIVIFEPAVQWAKNLMAKNTSFSETDFVNPYRVYIRKAQYQFGWDFCPSLPGCGIWRPVRLEGVSKARIDNVDVQTISCGPQGAEVRVTVELDCVTQEEFICKLALGRGGKMVRHDLSFKSGEKVNSVVMRIDNPLLWWPNGYGDQALYLLDIQLVSRGTVVDATQKQIGIRTIRLKRIVDSSRADFQFEVNDQTVFVKGANWVPASIYAGSAKDKDYERLLYAAKDTHMNMLRVWGGGYYESERFYELCDQLGLMIWQDFMFACAYYPDRQWFLHEIETEAAAVIKRLRSHPCVVLWCGNNEIDWLHELGKFGKRKRLYGKQIYHNLLPRLTAGLDPQCPYIPSTPLIEKGPTNVRKQLTTHRWEIWSCHEPVRRYLTPSADVPCFVTEFGMQSIPCHDTVKSFCPAQQLHVASRGIEKHNYQLDGNSRLYRYVADLFALTEDFEQLIYLSQVTQARAVKSYVEHLRAHRRQNKGVLFWQFNDCAPAISWSAIDYSGRPKALYYYAKRFLADLLITAVPEFDSDRPLQPGKLRSLHVIVINDRPEPLAGTLSCRLIDLFGRGLDAVSLAVEVAPFDASEVLTLPDALSHPPQPEESCLHLQLLKNGKKAAENLYFFLPDKHINWPKPRFEKHVSLTNGKSLRLRLKSNAVIRDMQITCVEGARLADNFIDLVPPDEVEIILPQLPHYQPVAAIEQSLQVRSFKLRPLQD